MNLSIIPTRSAVGLNRRIVTTVSLLAIGILGVTLSVRSAEQKTEFTLSEFLAAVREQGPRETLQVNVERAAEIFSRLLVAQGKLAAARQSLDRLSGWHKSVLARVQAQSAPGADEELLRFSEANAVAHVAQFEAERRDALREANLLLKRPPESAMVALMEVSQRHDPERANAGANQSRGRQGAGTDSSEPAPKSPDKQKEPGSLPSPAAQVTTTPPSDLNPDISSRKAQFEKELLPLGTELLAKMYQSYLFGGIPLTALLWQEQQVYQTEMEYRLLLVEAERKGAGKRE